MLNAKAIIHFCAIAGGMTLAVATSAFTIAPQTKSLDDSYFFEYQPGEIVANPSSWEYTPDESECRGDGKSCKIEIKADYVDELASPVVIDSLALPNGQLPTTINSISSLEVPDASSSVYNNVYNQDQ